MLNNIQLEMVAKLEHTARLDAAAKWSQGNQSKNTLRLLARWRQWWRKNRTEHLASATATPADTVRATPQHQAF